MRFHSTFSCLALPSQLLCHSPTNIASAHLVMNCPNARAGVKILVKKEPESNLARQNFSLITTSVDLVIPLLVGGGLDAADQWQRPREQGKEGRSPNYGHEKKNPQDLFNTLFIEVMADIDVSAYEQIWLCFWHLWPRWVCVCANFFSLWSNLSLSLFPIWTCTIISNGWFIRREER